MPRRADVYRKLSDWVEENPDGYYHCARLSDIAKAIGVSSGSVVNLTPQILAKREGMLPSEVIAKRKKLGSNRGNQLKLTQTQKKQICDMYNEGTEIIDIAYLMGCSIPRVDKVIINEN